MSARQSLLLSTTLLLGLPAPAGAQEWFREEALAAGIDWTHVNGQQGRYWFPEIMGGGVALFDYDGDGDLDLYLIQSGSIEPQDGQERPANRLLRNRGDGTFESTAPVLMVEEGEEREILVDLAEHAGVDDTGYGMGAACGDYDQDGDVDLFVTNLGANVLYRNDGDGTFTDVTRKMKVADGRWGTAAAFFDADGDGDLDLFLVNGLNWDKDIEVDCENYRRKRDYCSPNNYNAQSADVLYIQGRLGFQDSSRLYGIHLASGNGLGICCADYDLDGDIDIYVANDATPNVLWRNHGKKVREKGGFEERALQSGCAVNGEGTAEAGMGVQWVDIDQNGLPDLFMTHLGRETNTFYLARKSSSGRLHYRDVTRMTGLGAPSLRYTGFGMAFHDLDLDGVLDLYVANGAVQAWGEDVAFDPDDPYAEPNQLFRGLGGTRFEFLGEGTPEPVIGTSRGAAFGDIDDDGDIDIVVVDQNARVKLLRNVAPRKGSWIGLRVLNERGCDVIGAAVELVIRPRGSEQPTSSLWRVSGPAYSYLSSNDPRVHFGIPAEHEVVEVRVRWPGTQALQSFGSLELARYHEIRRGR